MRKITRYIRLLFLPALVTVCLAVSAQETGQKKKPKPVKNTFETGMMGDNQTVMVPSRNTFTFDIQHRFGTWKKGYEDFFGLFASSNIRLGVSYSFLLNNLNLGLGYTKGNMLWDLDAKYAIIKQTKGKWPVSVTYYGSMEVDTRKKENFQYTSDRFSFFHEIMIAHKCTDKFSVQLAPSLTHVNSVNAYYGSNGKLKNEMEHEHFALAVTARYKLKETMAVFMNYNQPITKHNVNNPHPNLLLGLEMTTSAHSFQFFAGNYYAISPVRNNMFNKMNYRDNDFLIGFNISRLWNY